MYQLQIGAEANIPVAFARYTLSFSISGQCGQVQVTVVISLFVHSSNIFYCYGFLHWKSLNRKTQIKNKTKDLQKVKSVHNVLIKEVTSELNSFAIEIIINYSSRSLFF